MSDPRSPVLDRLKAQLEGAEFLLDAAAQSVKATDLDHHTNIRRIAEALEKISEIQNDLWEIEPELVPLFMRDTKRWKPYFDKNP